MVFRYVERLEIVVVKLDLGTLGDLESHSLEVIDDALHHLGYGVLGADRHSAAGKSEISRVLKELFVHRPALYLVGFPLDQLLDFPLGSVYENARLAALGRGNVLH